MNNVTDCHTLVAFREVQKSYDGETLVVKNLNLDIAKGEFLTMLGPSGSGKSTVLMMLAGFESPTHGVIRLNGMPIDSVAPHKRGFGMVFQNYALFPHMTVEENVAFPLKVRGIRTLECTKKVQKALEMVRLEGMQKRRIMQLSGGQQQRIALARALVFSPELVLMDEPLGALDKNLREEMQYEIKNLHENLGVTVVYVTHDQSEALTMSNRIAVFHNGVIEQIDTPEVLYECPNNAFVARFIGESNQLYGEVVQMLDNGVCQVKLDRSDAIIKALVVNVAGIGSRTIVSLRPERVYLGETPQKHIDNMIDAIVQEHIYLGDHIRARVDIAGNENFIVKIPNNRVKHSLSKGTKTSLSWRAVDCRALDYQG